jgi:ribosomal protein S12 methylthiotransferase accessory factor
MKGPGLAGRDRRGEEQKDVRNGMHRTTDPRITLRNILPRVKDMGVTRIANLTGLDVLGMPVVAAVRPNSRSLAVHQGKGLSLVAAKVSAIMEAAEAFHAEYMDAPLRFGRRDEMKVPTVDPNRLARGTGDADPATTRILWAEGTDLATGGPRWVPYETVNADYTAPQPPGSGLFQATTNGLGAGNHPIEAMVHALAEVVERDAVSLWHADGAAEARSARAIDPASVTDPECLGLLRRLAVCRVTVGIWDVSSDARLPTFVCLLVPPDDRPDGVEPEIGDGCHVVPGIALLRAMTEAAQARITRISGARDDYSYESYGAEARAARLAIARRWLAAARGKTRSFRDRPITGGPTLQHDLDVMLEHLAQIGCNQVVWIDLTKPEIGIPVGRVVVPGLEGPWSANGEYTPGMRAQRMAPA